MKKFLFTLAALLMAGSLCAEEYMYIDDFEVSQEMLAQTAARNRRITVNVKAHFEAYVSAWQVDLGGEEMNVLPEGVTVFNAAAGADMTVPYMDIACNELTVSGSWGTGQNNTRFISAIAGTTGYWFAPGLDPDNDDPVPYGIVKWLGDYEQMFTVTFQFAQDFTGAQLTVWTAPSSGTDERGPVCERNQLNTKTFNITVEGGEVPVPDLGGQIVFGDVTEDGLLPVSYNGTEDVTITVTLNGEPVELVDGNVQLVEGNNIVTVTVSAEGYNDMTATYEGEWTAPLPPTPEQTEAPVITVVDDPEAQTVTVTATGNGHICLYWDDMLQAEGEGEAVWVIPYGDDPEGEEYGVSATAQEEGKEVSEYTLETVFVPGKTDTPEPPTPTHPGYWLVMVQADGSEQYIELNLGANGDYITAYDVIWPLYVNVGNFYFVIDDVAYGAEADGTEAFLGDAMMNPLSAENTNTYWVYNGYSYSIGIHLVINEDTMEIVGYTAYVAKGGPVSVDELVNGKTVAGVRYYNMAGQEMQEANGMTIVVTTYTDGTTSSVKVMK